ncbi:MAG: zf-HC2 domain-containing protein [Blautia sp.]|nr:zf-HC2 domain-containing protein [Lachnoclostridium sp.]MCM1211482.1 zf-HC2 domain-containing protein [Blautia sp.]
MEKKTCDIIRDLLPSYLDNICSETTKEYVKEHLETCEECREIATFYKDNTFSAQKTEQKALDGLRRIRGVLKCQNLIACLIFLFPLLYSLIQFLTNTASISLSAYYILLAICLSAGILIAVSAPRGGKMRKTDCITCVIELVLDSYLAFLLLYFATTPEHAVRTFHLDSLEECGGFLKLQLTISLLLHFVFLIRHLFCIYRLKRDCSSLLNIDLMGICLAIGYDLLLHRLDTPEGFLMSFAMLSCITVGLSFLGLLAVRFFLHLPCIIRTK